MTRFFLCAASIVASFQVLPGCTTDKVAPRSGTIFTELNEAETDAPWYGDFEDEPQCPETWVKITDNQGVVMQSAPRVWLTVDETYNDEDVALLSIHEHNLCGQMVITDIFLYVVDLSNDADWVLDSENSDQDTNAWFESTRHRPNYWTDPQATLQTRQNSTEGEILYHFDNLWEDVRWNDMIQYKVHLPALNLAPESNRDRDLHLMAGVYWIDLITGEVQEHRVEFSMDSIGTLTIPATL